MTDHRTTILDELTRAENLSEVELAAAKLRVLREEEASPEEGPAPDRAL